MEVLATAIGQEEEIKGIETGKERHRKMLARYMGSEPTFSFTQLRHIASILRNSMNSQ